MPDARTSRNDTGTRNVYDRFCYKVDSLCRASSRDLQRRGREEGAPLKERLSDRRFDAHRARRNGSRQRRRALNDERSRISCTNSLCGRGTASFARVASGSSVNKARFNGKYRVREKSRLFRQMPYDRPKERSASVVPCKENAKQIFS